MRRWDKLYYVGGKAKQSGELQGELAADFIKVNPQADRNNDGKIQYVILEGEMGHQDAIIRTESVVESLKAVSYTHLDVYKRQACNLRFSNIRDKGCIFWFYRSNHSKYDYS